MSTSPGAVVVPPNGGTWVSWIGGPLQYVATGDQTNGTYCALTGTVAPNAGPPPHRHNFHEGFYVLEGEVTFYAGREKVRLGKGDFINIAAGTVHRLCNESAASAELLTIAAPAGFDRFQFEAGEVIGGPNESGSLGKEEIAARMQTVASRYNIDLNPPEEAFDEAARITVCRAGEGKPVAVVGDLYTFLVEGSDTDQTYALWHALVPPGGGPPPHVHRREEEAFLILSGEVTFYADGQRHPCGPGSFVALRRDGLHRFCNEGEKPAEMLIFVAPAGFEQMFHEAGQPWLDRSQPVPPPTPVEIERLLEVAPRFGVELQLPQ